MRIVQPIFIGIIMTVFSSCFGQKQNNSFELSKESSVFGKSVTELDERIWNIYQDDKNNYWFGSRSHGVFYYDGKKLINYTTQDGLIDNDVSGIQGDHLSNIFIHSDNGICKFIAEPNEQTKQGKAFTTMGASIPTSEWKLEPNDLWFNCWGIIYRYDGKSLYKLKLPRHNLYKAFGTMAQGLSFEGMNHSPYAVYGLNKDSKGNLWIGTIVAGAYRYDGKSFLWFPEKELSTLPDGRVPGVRSLLEDKNGYFWLSNFISKYKVNEEEDTVTYKKMKGINESDEVFNNRIGYFNSGVRDKNGNLWMTTYSRHIWKYDGEKLVDFPIPRDGKEVLLISIYIDKQGIFWLGTDNAGVYKFDGETFEKFDPQIK